MKEFIDKHKKILDYLPLMLLTLLFITEAELEKHAVHLSCQMVITIVCMVVFFIIAINIKNSRVLAFTIALFFWVVLIYAKNVYIPKK